MLEDYLDNEADQEEGHYKKIVWDNNDYKEHPYQVDREIMQTSKFLSFYSV